MLNQFETWLDDPWDYMTLGEQVVYFKCRPDLDGTGKDPKDVDTRGYTRLVRSLPIEMLIDYYKSKLDAVWAGEDSQAHHHFIKVRETLRNTFYRQRQVKLGRINRLPPLRKKDR